MFVIHAISARRTEAFESKLVTAAYDAIRASRREQMLVPIQQLTDLVIDSNSDWDVSREEVESTLFRIAVGALLPVELSGAETIYRMGGRPTGHRGPPG